MCLERQSTAYKQDKTKLGYCQHSKWFVQNKTQIEEFVTVNTTSIQQTLRKLDKSFQAFFRRIKQGQKPGYPRFKGQDRFNSVVFILSDGAGIKDERLYIQHVGHIKVKWHRELRGTIKSITIKQSAGNWYVTFCCEVPKPHPLPVTGRITGIDVGIESFVTTSEGQQVQTCQPLKKNLKHLRRLQRALSRKKRGSNSRTKAKHQVVKLYEHVSNTRRDIHHKTARQLVNQFDKIAVEDLDIKGMLNTSYMSRMISDSGWGNFLNILTYKAEEAGRLVVKVDPRGTSQQCSQCGTIVQKALSCRKHNCTTCGLVLHRDHNAALNILNRAFKSPEGALVA